MPLRRTTPLRRTASATFLAGATALVLAACGAPSAQTGTEPPASFTAAPWAMPVTPVGTWLNSAATDDMRVDVYRAGTAIAPEASSWEISDTSEAFFEAGAEVQIIQIIVTNTGAEPITIGHGRIDTSYSYRDFETRTVPTESRLVELLPAGVYDSGMDSSQNDINDMSDDRYDKPLGAGESIAYGQGLMYRPDDRLSVDLRLWTYLGDGEWDFGEPYFYARSVLLSEPQ